MNIPHLESADLADTSLQPWSEALVGLHRQAWAQCRRHGDEPRWRQALESLPEIVPQSVDLNADCIRIGRAEEIEPARQQQLKTALAAFHPWRKGPFSLFGITIDCEWRSDWKWQRLQHAIAPLAGRIVLDIGCGSGYHGWRMLGAGAARVIGVEPTVVYAMQYRVMQHFIRNPAFIFLPAAMESLPAPMPAFDTVFSMGLLYHRRSPIDHLLGLKDLLRPGGELVLETLIIEEGGSNCLIPEDRYARMRNVWFIPSVPLLRRWLERSGFVHVRLIDVSPTTPEEQRRTEWMRFESLSDFLDPANPKRTIEGYPAPVRAILLAQKP